MVDALRNTAQSASNMVAENVSVPIDAIAWALRKAGVPVDKPMFGSDWLKEKGVTPQVEQGASKVIGDTIGMVSPLGFTKQGAQALIEGAGKLKNIPVGNMFIGETANTWDEVAAAQAKMLERQGKTPQEIWKETGTFKGPDGKYRQEIDDSAATLTEAAAKSFTPGVLDTSIKPFVGNVQQSINHADLQKSYPDWMRDIEVRSSPRSGGGAFYSREHFMDPTRQVGVLEVSKAASNPKSTMLHELQHAIQDKEKFASGGSASDFNGNVDMYRRLAGEAEARATQARMNLNAKQRRELFPLDSYDTPIDQLIIK
jgi:hypothetical protein